MFKTIAIFVKRNCGCFAQGGMAEHGLHVVRFFVSACVMLRPFATARPPAGAFLSSRGAAGRSAGDHEDNCQEQGHRFYASGTRYRQYVEAGRARGIFQCPSGPAKRDGNAASGTQEQYGINIFFASDHRARSVTRIKEPAARAMAMDHTSIRVAQRADISADVHPFRHNQGVNVVFVDTHAEWIGYSEIPVNATPWSGVAGVSEEEGYMI